MSTIGKIEQFDPSVEEWETYEERLEQFFIVNDLEAEKKVPALLSLIGAKTYALLKNLLTPVKPSTKSYKELTDILKGHFSPQTTGYC